MPPPRKSQGQTPAKPAWNSGTATPARKSIRPKPDATPSKPALPAEATPSRQNKKSLARKEAVPAAAKAGKKKGKKHERSASQLIAAGTDDEDDDASAQSDSDVFLTPMATPAKKGASATPTPAKGAPGATPMRTPFGATPMTKVPQTPKVAMGATPGPKAVAAAATPAAQQQQPAKAGKKASTQKRAEREAPAAEASPAKPASAQKPARKTAEAAMMGGSNMNVVVADNVAPASLGVAALDLNAAESHLVTARVNGSVALYRIVVATKKSIFHFVPVAATGGRKHMTITKVRFFGAEDEFIAASLMSGQVVQYAAASLAPLHVVARAGGAIRDLCKATPTALYGACADGALRCYSLREGSAKLAVTQTMPKIAGSERALCIAADAGLKMVVAGDDARHVVAWEMRDPEERGQRQLWVTELPNGYPLSLAVVAEHSAVAVGTSFNQVLFIDARQGVVVNAFTHHKGPVACLAAADGVTYASGWHELLRAYRCGPRDGDDEAATGASDIAPAEAKRRTHYHECTAVAIGQKTELALSAAKDGTVMFANLPTLFSKPASYFDSHPGTQPYSVTGPFVTTFKDATVEMYRILPHELLPIAKFTMAGDFHVKGVWPNADFTRLCVATDERVAVIGLEVNLGNNVVNMTKLREAEVCGVAAAAFYGADACYVAAGKTITHLQCAAAADAPSKKKARKDAAGVEAAPQDLASVSVKGVVTTLLFVDGAEQPCLFAATTAPAAAHFFRLATDGSSAVRSPPSTEHVDVLSASVVGADVFFHCPTDNKHYLCKPPSQTQEATTVEVKKPRAVSNADLPLTATVIGRLSDDGKCLAYFNNGLISFLQGNAQSWKYSRAADRRNAVPNTIKQKCEFAASLATSCFAGLNVGGNDDDDDEDVDEDAEAGAAKAAAAAAAPRTVLLLQRNIDGMLEQLPPMWRVRRFGN
jgi:hypothetical protein